MRSCLEHMESTRRAYGAYRGYGTHEENGEQVESTWKVCIDHVETMWKALGERRKIVRGVIENRKMNNHRASAVIAMVQAEW